MIACDSQFVQFVHVDDERVQRSVVPFDLSSKATKAALKQHGTTMGSPQMVRGGG